MNMLSPLNGFASVQSSDPKTARYFRITFPERGKPVLSVGPGDHTLQRWHLSMDDIRGLVIDVMPELLRR
jgi:hypothetical protein